MVSVVISIIITALTVFSVWMSFVDRTTKIVAKDMNHMINQDVRHLLQSPYDMMLSELDSNLAQIAEEKEGYSFIVDQDSEEMIANSFGIENYTILEDGSLKRIKVSDISNRAIKKGYEEFKKNLKDNYVIEDKDDNFFVTVTEYKEGGFNWYIISAIPYHLFSQNIKYQIVITATILAIVALTSIIFHFMLTRRLIRPIDSLIALQRTKEELYLILDSTAEGIFGIDIDGNCSFCNNRCIELLGYQHQNELIGKNIHPLIHHSRYNGDKIGCDSCKIINTLRTGESAFVDNEVFWKADGSCFDVEYYSYPQVKDGILSGVVVTFTDSTERRRNEEQIRYLSSYDALTGLMNRGCFERVLKQYDTKDNLPITIMFADLNGLKLVNDVFGHSSGDLLIKKAAEALKKTCRSEDILARVGGDEFIVLLPRTEARDAQKIIERIETALSKEKINCLSCSMAIGFDTKVSYYNDLEKVMSSAESEMYHVKLTMKKSFGNDTIHTIMDSLEQRSEQVRIHSENIARLCEQMGRTMHLSDPEIKKLHDAGYMHDIGKIVLSDEVLSKKNELSEYDNQRKQQHPVVGYRILNLFDDTLDLADVVYAHHERFDGSGYPKGLKGDEIPLISRIIAIAEYYERLITRELVLGNLEWEDVYQKIRKGAGTSFDPELVEDFIRMLEEYEEK